MIEIKNIVKEFEKLDENKKKIKIKADNDISFEVKEGEVVGLLGPNGAGKTTLLRIIAGIMKPNKGSITIDDKNYKKNELEIKKMISFLSGNTKLYKELSPMELMQMCADFYKVDKKEASNRIDDIVKRFSMQKFKNQRIETLSTGQTQRVGIARCLVHNPKYYIFDEATSGLDIISSKVILDFIKEEKKNGKGIIYSTHYMEEAENICDRVILLNKGRVIATGTPKQILKETNTDNLRDAFFALIGDDKNE
jgi:sodium transport system ATP-binding protein